KSPRRTIVLPENFSTHSARSRRSTDAETAFVAGGRFIVLASKSNPRPASNRWRRSRVAPATSLHARQAHPLRNPCAQEFRAPWHCEQVECPRNDLRSQRSAANQCSAQGPPAPAFRS